VSAPAAPTSPPERPFSPTAVKVLVVEALVLVALWALQARFTP
jgi:hypothetical protein